MNRPIGHESIVFMGWATHYIEKLRAGETVSFRPRGASMKGRIESGHLCTVVPVDCSSLSVGDIVLCKVHGAEYLHIVKAHQRPTIPNRQQSRGNQRLDRDEWHLWKVHSYRAMRTPLGKSGPRCLHDDLPG